MKLYDPKNCLVNLGNSILKRFNVPTFHDTIPEIDEILKKKKKVVLFLFDAMGKNVLEANPKETKNLRGNVFKEITSTFPPTTVAATNGLLSCKFPTENGWLSWSQYFKEYDKNINVFQNCDSQTMEKVDGFNYREDARYDNLAQLINKTNNKEIARVMQQEPIQQHTYNSICAMMTEAEKVIRSYPEEGFVYAYHTEPDHTCHMEGITSRHIKHILKQINKFVPKFARRNPDTLILVIADHGHVNVEPCILEEHPDLVELLERPFSFEVRSSNFFVKKGQEEKFKELFNKYYGEYFELYSKQEVIDNEFYGPKDVKDKSVFDFFGDFIAISVSNKYFAPTKKDAFFKGHHAGGTPEEMALDLIAYNYED